MRGYISKWLPKIANVFVKYVIFSGADWGCNQIICENFAFICKNLSKLDDATLLAEALHDNSSSVGITASPTKMTR